MTEEVYLLFFFFALQRNEDTGNTARWNKMLWMFFFLLCVHIS